MEFDKSQESSWNVLVVYVNSQWILAGSKPQKNFFFAFCLIFTIICEFLKYYGQACKILYQYTTIFNILEK